MIDFVNEAQKLNIDLDSSMLAKFDTYFHFLVEYNEHVNLTALTQEDDVYVKHFLDSLTISSLLHDQDISLCDVGSGAGFPSIPLAITNNKIKVTIIDALNKRIVFLNELIAKLGLDNVYAYHARAEEYAINNRETFDVVTARAVAKLNLLCELCLPLTKVGGYFIAMKSSNANDELKEALRAISTLGGIVEKRVKLSLPYEAGEREIIVIKKIKASPLKYPRSFSLIKNKPL